MTTVADNLKQIEDFTWRIPARWNGALAYQMGFPPCLHIRSIY